ncbi:MAG: two-component regulator propeller domain-containing protein, partial [Flavisolibacter sp.]
MRSAQVLINCLFVYLCSTTNTLAQPTPNFLERLTTREGLSSNKINDIVQDEDGFLWIATPDGLNRFDGTEKRHYYHVDSLNTIINNYVNCLKKFHGNHIVIGTQGGLSFLNPRTGVFKNLYYYGKGALADYDNVITELQVDTKGNLWAVSKNCIYIFDSVLQLKRIIFSHYTESDAATQRLNFVEEIFPLSNGNMLLYLNDGWYICSAALKEPVKLEKSLLSSPLHFISETTSPGFNKKDDHYFPAANIFKLPGPYFIRIQPRKDSLELFDETGVKQSSCFFPYNKYPFISWSQKLAIIDSTRLLFLFHNYGLMEIKLTWQNNIPSITRLSPVLFEKEEFVTAMKDQ